MRDFPGVLIERSAPQAMQPLPPIRIAATSPDTFTINGRQGLPIVLAVRHEIARMFAPQIAAYREAYAAAGHPGRGQVFLRVPAYIAGTPREARQDAAASLLHYYHAQSRLLADSAKRAGVDAADRRNATAERLATMTYDEALRGSVFIGTPNSVSAQLKTLQDELGLDGILLELNCGGKIPHPRVMEATQLLCQEVQPRFH